MKTKKRRKTTKFKWTCWIDEISRSYKNIKITFVSSFFFWFAVSLSRSVSFFSVSHLFLRFYSYNRLFNDFRYFCFISPRVSVISRHRTDTSAHYFLLSQINEVISIDDFCRCCSFSTTPFYFIWFDPLSVPLTHFIRPFVSHSRARAILMRYDECFYVKKELLSI